MKRRALLVPIIIVLIFAGLSLGLLASCSMPNGVASLTGDRVGLLYMEGLIQSGRPGGFSFTSATGTMSDQIVEVIQQAIDNKSIKAMVIRVNSPGGSSAASDEIYKAVKRFRDSGRPVIVSMADVAASGGYYVSCAANEIYANPSTLTGSIGVAMPLAGYQGLYKLIGLEDRTLSAGKFKEIGSPTRPMTDEEKTLLQTMINQVYDQFWAVVASERGYKDDQRLDIAEGKIYNGEQAKDVGLIDALGGLHDAVARAGTLAGLGEKPVVEELGKTGLLDQLLGTSSTTSRSHVGPVGDALNTAINPLKAGENPIYRLWQFLLVAPDLMGEQAGIQY
jgi:protease IV